MYPRWLLLLFFGFYPRLDALRGTLGELSWVCLGEVVGERISSRDIIKWVPCENRLVQLAGEEVYWEEV
jgi:hypothetical protein